MNSWREVRRHLNTNRHALARRADLLYPDLPRVGSTHLLTRPAWALPEPLDLHEVVLRWTEETPPVPVPDGMTYAEAMTTFDKPKLFENRTCYRLLDVSWPELTFTRGMYFDAVNVGEAIAHEFAAADLAGGPDIAVDLSSRRLVPDPTDLRDRPAHPAISMLTLRHDRETGETTFVLHWRDPALVAHGGGLFQVMPVGVFQPSAESPQAERADFDLWKCVVREYAEEFLGRPEHYGPEFDYETWPLYRRLTDARESGDLRSMVLGIGVDPLTFATDILAVTVIEARTFDAVFGAMTGANAEGHATMGVPFDEESAGRYVTREPMQAAGAAVLELAWGHLRGSRSIFARQILRGQQGYTRG
ncbi:transcriptional regulator [Herbidospora sp. NEAU-GS84]|uniref:Transcriptional regulator n=1 Tax=Herbidospora solisilvae TaxID=2696284 RepID=A0A7C9N8B0_9ACTN|nr:transcriptional regulator [Herbidospora solisilvae]NAS23853.1 transcriptional regulator [Herbidospora solisilvae]